MASIRPGTTAVRWREPGDDGRIVSRTKVCSTAASARELLRRVQRCEDLGIRYVPEPERVRPPSIGDGVTAYLVDLRRSHAAITVERYRSALALFADYLDDTRKGVVLVDELSREMLAGFYDWLERGRHGARRALYTKRRIVEKVEALWEWLFDVEFSAAVPRPRAIDMQRAPPAPIEAAAFGEMAACVKACVSEGPRRLATVLYYTGLRTAQALRLDWSAVDVERGTLRVLPHKGLPGRIIPLSPHFVRELAAWGVRDGRVVGWDVGETIARRRLSEAWARAGVRRALWERAPGKAFRRGLTSGLAALGVDRERAELYIGRAVQGARSRYLDVGVLPFDDVARAIPAIDAGGVIQLGRARR